MHDRFRNCCSQASHFPIPPLPLLFLCNKGTRAFLQRTCKMLRMLLLFLLLWVAPRWYLRYLTQRSASSLIGSIRINIGIRHLMGATCYPDQTQTMGWHRVAPRRKTLRRCHYMLLLLVGVQAAKQIVTELVKKSSQLVSSWIFAFHFFCSQASHPLKEDHTRAGCSLGARTENQVYTIFRKR